MAVLPQGQQAGNADPSEKGRGWKPLFGMYGNNAVLELDTVVAGRLRKALRDDPEAPLTLTARLEETLRHYLEAMA